MRPELPAHWMAQLAAIFSQWAPEFEVWAYGSRVTGNCHDASDLDLVLIHPTAPDTTRCDHWFEIREALSESNIPICVDVMDWARVSPEFHQQMDKLKVKLFEAIQP
jgi:uncharacterized protein